jgi:rRNA maturation RNase YbeY
MKAMLIELFGKEKVPVELIEFIFCNDEYLLRINRDFLQHDDLTDIITFDLSNPFPGEPLSNDLSGDGRLDIVSRKTSPTGGGPEAVIPKHGEIYISVERVLENAATVGVGRLDELRRVMFHGCLHLCGYKDKLNEEKVLMRKMEDKYLRLYKLRST